jgi:hypothetical protein
VTLANLPWRTILVAVTVGLAAAWAVLGWLLLVDYRPGSATVTTAYQAIGALLGVAALAIVIVDRRRLDVVPIAGLGAVAAIAAVMTVPQVLWDSLLLASVTSGESVRGVWWPVANADQVQLIVVAGREVEPDTFRAVVYANVVSAAAVLMTVPLAALLGLRPVALDPDED